MYKRQLYIFEPMIHVKKLMYLNVDLYHYYIGREGQSVNEKTMMKRIDQQMCIRDRIRASLRICIWMLQHVQR